MSETNEYQCALEHKESVWQIYTRVYTEVSGFSR